jgi:hypothetical protein
MVIVDVGFLARPPADAENLIPVRLDYGIAAIGRIAEVTKVTQLGAGQGLVVEEFV